MATYITAADITDTVITSLATELTAKLLLSDAAVEDLAERKEDLAATDIETAPVHYMLKKWAAAWVCREICLDKMGVNNVEFSADDKYKVKYDVYQKLLASYESQITRAVFLGSVSSVQDRAVRSGNIFRA